MNAWQMHWSVLCRSKVVEAYASKSRLICTKHSKCHNSTWDAYTEQALKEISVCIDANPD